MDKTSKNFSGPSYCERIRSFFPCGIASDIVPLENEINNSHNEKSLIDYFNGHIDQKKTKEILKRIFTDIKSGADINQKDEKNENVLFKVSNLNNFDNYLTRIYLTIRFKRHVN
jgi:hypothetical protein